MAYRFTKQDGYNLAILGGLITLFFHRMAFTQLILARGDTYLYFYP